jgi:hypothetical protein
LLTWAIGGQSNAVGWAIGQLSDAPLEQVQAWNPATQSWETATEPLPFVAHPNPAERVGPWVSAARSLVRSGQVNRIRLTGYAQGSTSMAHWAPDGLIWQAFERAIRDAGNVDLFLWFQAESDADRPLAYIEDDVAMIERVRAVVGKPNLPVIICGVVNYPGFDAIRDAQRAAVSRVSNAYFVPTDDLPADGQHLTLEGYHALADRLAALIPRLFQVHEPLIFD